MTNATTSRRRKTAAAFTLVELLLTVALMLLLAGAVIINFGAMDRNARLEEGASQVETLFRYARAQAANTGRQVRIVFGFDGQLAGGGASTNQPQTLAGTNAGFQMLWEPDPVAAPGRFEVLRGAELLLEQVNDLVQVREVRQPGAKSGDAASLDGSSQSPSSQVGGTNQMASLDAPASSMPPLTCYPDGSSDSAEIVLAAASGEDTRLAMVTLSGLTGASRHRLTASADDLDPVSEQIAPVESRRDQ